MQHAAHAYSTLPFSLGALLVAACYSPNDEVATPTASSDQSSSTGGDTDDAAPTSATVGTDVTAAGSATTTSTTSDPMDSSGASGSESSADASSGEPADPFCGDGNVDPGEECDLGEENALTAECRPDCNLARCGDGDVWPGGEECDDGDENNVLEIGACAPDCSRVIEEKMITDGTWITGGGDFGNNPVAFADSTCEPGYSAVFAVPGIREASSTPYTGDDGLDWVLQPYTAYVNSSGEPVWITDATPLLGVRDGAPEPLVSPIFSLSFTQYISGLNANWTTSASNTCNGWSSELASDMVRFGDASSLSDFIVDSTTDCENWSFFVGGLPLNTVATYCVEQ